MNATMPRYSREEFAQWGSHIYERDIRPLVEADNAGKFVAIDIETGAWEMDEGELEAGSRLRARVPDAQVWMVRVGFPTLRRIARNTPSISCLMAGGDTRAA